MKYIGMKLFLGFISMTILTIGVLWIAEAGFMRNFYMNQRMDDVHRAIDEATNQSIIDYEALSEDNNIGLIVLDQSGTDEYHSPGIPAMGMMIRTAESMMSNQTDGTPHFVRTKPGNTRFALIGLERADGGYIFAVFSMADLDGSSRFVLRQLQAVTLVMVVLSVLLAVFLSRKISRPILAVTLAANKLASGSFDVRLPVESRDEIGQLTEALNNLGVELGRTENLRHELIANVSHELRSPLTVIQGYAETVRDVTWPDETKRTEQLNTISDEASRLTRVVKDILDYSRLQAGMEHLEKTRFSTGPVLDRLLKKFAMEAKQHHVILRTQGPDMPIFFDRDRFDQVMHNLINNAMNHARPNSVIEISVSDADGICKMEVKNQGNPIPPEAILHIWDRYYRADQIDAGRPMGTGLGLAIVKSILDRHEVRYGVHSDTDQTVFWFESCRYTSGD